VIERETVNEMTPLCKKVELSVEVDSNYRSIGSSCSFRDPRKLGEEHLAGSESALTFPVGR
jgi:hypothetical protein